MITYAYKLKPKAKRDDYLGDLIDRHNMLWNKFVWLNELSRKWRGKHLTGKVLNNYVNLHKKGHGWDYIIKGLDAQSIQAAIDRREMAFDKFFKCVKNKKEGKPIRKDESPPDYKRVKGPGSFTLKQSGWKIGNSEIHIGRGRSKWGPTEIHTFGYFDSRPIEGKIKTLTIKRDSLKDFWLYVVTDTVPFEPLPKTGIDAGFDFGSDHFFTDSHGNYWDAPRFHHKYLVELKKLDKKISRCKNGSQNQKRLNDVRSRLNRFIVNSRNDWQWKMAWEMCKKYDTLCFENLDLIEMRKHKKKEEKGLSHIDKKRLRKWREKVGDYSPGSFIQKVKWVAKKTGKKVLIVPSKWEPTSQKCNKCKFVNPVLRDLKVRKWKCPNCGAIHDRDVNAAINAEVDAKAGDAGKESKGTRGCAGGASSVDVGQNGNPVRASRWARIRKPSKPQGRDAGLTEENLHGTQNLIEGLTDETHQPIFEKECQEGGGNPNIISFGLQGLNQFAGFSPPSR